MHAQPYHPGTTSRSGNPWSSARASPFIPVTSHGPSSVSISRGNTQLAPGRDRVDVAV